MLSCLIMQHECPALCVFVCVQVCVCLSVSKYVHLHAWMNSPHHHAQLLHVPQAVAVSAVMIRGHSVQQQVFICLSCHDTLICGDYDEQTPQLYLLFLLLYESLRKAGC